MNREKDKLYKHTYIYTWRKKIKWA